MFPPVNSPYLSSKRRPMVSPPSSDEDRWSSTDSFAINWEIRRNSELWLEDGNVIINTYDRSKLIRHQIRVHSSVLCLHSSWWRGLLPILQPRRSYPESSSNFTPKLSDPFKSVGDLESDELRRLADPTEQGDPIDGIQPIEAAFDPDPAAFALLLRQIYYPYESLGPTNTAQSDNVTHSLLRLAHLYGMDYTRSELVSQLASSWPATLDLWDDKERQIYEILNPPVPELAPLQDGEDGEDEDENMVNDEQLPEIVLDLPDPARAIVIARECDLTSILPSAFYSLSRIPWSKVSDPTFAERSYRATDGVSFNLLSHQDVLRTIMGRERLQERARQFASVAISVNGAHAGCTRLSAMLNASCNVGIKRYWSTRLRSMILGAGMEDPIGALGDLMSDSLEEFAVCYNCEAEVRKRIQHTREWWWQRLGSDFKLWSDA